MASIDTHKTHSISWVDLAAADLAAGIEWYGGLFGWNTFNDGKTPYTIFMVGGSPVAGVMQIRRNGGNARWSTYVTVEDADATVAKVTAAGGNVFQQPFEISGRSSNGGDRRSRRCRDLFDRRDGRQRHETHG